MFDAVFQALRSAGVHIDHRTVAGTDHFDLVENLMKEEYEITQMIVKYLNSK